MKLQEMSWEVKLTKGKGIYKSQFSSLGLAPP